MFERQELQTLKSRIKEPRRFIQVIIGPRQVGKTTMVDQAFVQLDIPGSFQSADTMNINDSLWLQQVWEAARLKVRTQNLDEFLLIIDEVQKIHNWSEIIKSLWDEDSRVKINIKVVILGSSRLLVQKGLTESLAGRFETIYMTHWSFSEMSEAFGWSAEQYVWFGGYPGSASLINDELRWKRYIRDSLIETSISKDILMLSRINKPALLKNLFELGCIYSGQILSFNKIMGQLQDAGNTTTLSHYLKLLETAGLMGGLEKFSSNSLKKRSSSPKFQVFNNALLSAQSKNNFKEIMSFPEEWGRMVESSIGSYLLNQSLRQDFDLYYWRERNNEVDFVLEKSDQVIAIEVKSGISKYAKGMLSFSLKHKPHKTYHIDNINLTWQDFLQINPLDLF